jgi:hypothetical protein
VSALRQTVGVSLLVACLVASAASAGRPESQHVFVTATNFHLAATGLSSLHAGFVTFTVRNASTGEHGLAIVRLKRPMTQAKVLAAISSGRVLSFDPLGGVQAVTPGARWEGTVELKPGTYVIADPGENGGKANFQRGMLATFKVVAGARGAAPSTIGSIAMHDYSFFVRLPKQFDGKGIVAISNRGRTLHEISLVRTPRGKTATDVLKIFHAGVNMPRGYSVHELVSAMSRGHTSYIRFDLPRGHYVALCLITFGNSQKTHADAGMIAEFDVR